MGQDPIDPFGNEACLRAALKELLACADRHVETGATESLGMTEARARARSVLALIVEDWRHG